MRNTVIPVLFLIGLVKSAEAQVPEPFQISVNVNLVVLNPTVRDPKDGFVSDLREGDFQVYEDGVLQSIKVFRHEDIPVTVGLVVDHSGSMKPKLADVITAARTFVQSSRPDDRMFVVNFNEHVTVSAPGAALSANGGDALSRAIADTPATGKTALYDAVVEAFGRLGADGGRKQVLIVVSDGGDNASARKLAQVMKLAEQSSAVIYTIGVFDETDEDRNPGVLKHLAQATGGEAFLPNQLSEVAPICERIARDIRHQYTIGYVPTNPARDGAYRAIRVIARTKRHDKLSVRTRTGYIAGGEPRLDEKGAK